MATRSNFGSDEEYEAYQDGYVRGATKERHFGTPTPRTRGGSSFNGVLTRILMFVTIIVILGIGYTFLPTILATPLPTTWTLPTAAVAKPTRVPVSDPVDQPAAAPNVQQDIDNYNATQTAQFNAAQPNVDILPADAPMPQYVEKQAPDRAPAGVDNVSPAEPVTDDTHGNKQTEPVNIQATHQCLHGQIWTDSGCHRPTPVN